MRAAHVLALAWLMAVGSCQSAQQVQGSQGSPGSQGAQGEGKQLIMLEIERLNYPGEEKVVKRQAEVRYGGAPGQYVVQTSDQGGAPQQVPPEYLSLLQQLSPQPSQPHNIQQLFISRGPQGSLAQYQTPQPVAPLPLTPQQEEMRRLQENEANKHIREQQERALQRALQTGQFQPGFQPGPPPQSQPQQYQPQYQQQYQQPAPQPQQYQQQPQQYQQPAPQPQQFQPQPESQDYSQFDASSSFPSEPQYPQPQSGPQYYQTRSIRPAQVPEKFSYSEVKFGTSDIAREKLEPRLVSIEQRLQNQVKPQPQYYQVQAQPQPQAEPQRPVDYSAFGAQQPQQQTPTQPQHPQQYLIETTRPAQNEDNIVRIPRPRPPPQTSHSLYYRPDQPIAETLYAKAPEPYTTIPQSVYQAKAPEPYTTIPLSVYNQVPAQFSPAPQYRHEPQGIPLPSPDAPSRSAIYVHQTSIGKRITTLPPPSYSNYPGYTQGLPRIPTAQGQRPLTASEIKALSKAGFQISPLALNSLQESSEISPANEDESEEYKALSAKRQSYYVDERKPPGKYPKRIPKPVPLTETERKLLADQGIRNLYRVESSESKDAPVTYVLAIDNSMIRKRESEESQESKN